MTEQSRNDRAAEKAKPEELDAKELDRAAGGWGRSMYTSYSSESARFRAEDNSKGKS